MKHLLFLLPLVFMSFKDETTSDFNENLIDFMISHPENKIIEFHNLYDSLAENSPEDKDEKIILKEILKDKGFKIINSGRGNYPPLGYRIISFTMQKGNCECVVDKIYYRTISDKLYEMRERISCKIIQQ